MSDEDLWEAARARTREDVRQIFARTPEAPQRTCPHCGAQAQTREEHCPACGRSYFERPDRFSRRTRRALQGVGALAVAAALALVVVVLIHLAGDNGTSARERRAAAAAAERARLTREQRPHHATVAALRDDDLGAARATRVELVNRLESAITVDARGRVAATSCAPAASARRAATRWSTTRAATSSTCASPWAATPARPRSRRPATPGSPRPSACRSWARSTSPRAA